MKFHDLIGNPKFTEDVPIVASVILLHVATTDILIILPYSQNKWLCCDLWSDVVVRQRKQCKQLIGTINNDQAKRIGREENLGSIGVNGLLYILISNIIHVLEL